MQAILAQVADGTMLSKDAKAQLGLTNGSFYRLMNKHAVKRPLGMQRAAAKAAKATREVRTMTATLVIAGKITFEEGLVITKLHRTSLQRLINRIKASA